MLKSENVHVPDQDRVHHATHRIDDPFEVIEEATRALIEESKFVLRLFIRS